MWYVCACRYLISAPPAQDRSRLRGNGNGGGGTGGGGGSRRFGVNANRPMSGNRSGPGFGSESGSHAGDPPTKSKKSDGGAGGGKQVAHVGGFDMKANCGPGGAGHDAGCDVDGNIGKIRGTLGKKRPRNSTAESRRDEGVGAGLSAGKKVRDVRRHGSIFQGRVFVVHGTGLSEEDERTAARSIAR